MINNIVKVALCLGTFCIQYGNSMGNKDFIDNYLCNKEQNEIEYTDNIPNISPSAASIIQDWSSEYSQLHNEVETIINVLEASERLVHNADDAHSLIQNATNMLEKLIQSLLGKYLILYNDFEQLEEWRTNINDSLIYDANIWSTLQTIQQVRDYSNNLPDYAHNYVSVTNNLFSKKTMIAKFEQDYKNLDDMIWQKLQEFVKQFPDKQPNYFAKQYRKLVEDNDLIYHNVIQASPLFWDFDK